MLPVITVALIRLAGLLDVSTTTASMVLFGRGSKRSYVNGRVVLQSHRGDVELEVSYYCSRTEWMGSYRGTRTAVTPRVDVELVRH